MQTRVFVVYMNTALVSRLFALADQNGMMSKGYAWIITAGLSNSLNVLDSDVVDSMDGVLGVRSHAFLKESPLFSYFSKVILLVREIETKMDEIEKRYFGEKVTSATLAPTIYTESSSLRAYNFGGLFIIAGMATLLAIAVSERFIWQRPVALVRQYLTSNHPANGIELAAQPTAETDAGDHSPEVHQDSGNSGRISEHIKEDIAVE
ncbi:hypothetical protein WN944_002862 [Citrus x changshan-huyou]|uniref:Receptor ligand binding region domain-containing protein n=1 Tax=Citrus x changshan-huyou TaxID=2935761 RepID=A0AAP0QS74_9ROSI